MMILKAVYPWDNLRISFPLFSGRSEKFIMYMYMLPPASKPTRTNKKIPVPMAIRFFIYNLLIDLL